MPWPLTCSRTNRHPGPPITPILYSGTDHQTSLRAAYYTVDCLNPIRLTGEREPQGDDEPWLPAHSEMDSIECRRSSP